MNKTLLLLTITALVFTLGCGKKVSDKITESITEKILEQSAGDGSAVSDVKVNDDEISYTVTDKDGAKTSVQASGDDVSIVSADGKSTFVSGDKAKVPDDFPKDVLVYKPAKVVSAMTGPEGRLVSLQSDDALDAIAAEYQREMKAQGWKEESFFKAEAQTLAIFRKDKRVATVSLNPEDKGTAINVMVATEENE